MQNTITFFSSMVYLAMLFLMFPSASTAVSKPTPTEGYVGDIRSILTSRTGMQKSIEYIDSHQDIFNNATLINEANPLNRDKRMVIFQSWQNFLDHLLFLDTMGKLYAQKFHDSSSYTEKSASFSAAYMCFLSQYRFAIEYIGKMERSPDMHIMLNQPIPELGIERGTYTKVKFRFLNVIRGIEFARLNIAYLYYKKSIREDLQSAIEEDSREIWQAGGGQGSSLTLENALQIVSDVGFTAWFPVQKNISQLMGNIKVWRPSISLISPEQKFALKQILKPGDILLQRREWYATNVGIPGFWTHAALYVGTPAERTEYFSTPEIREWLVTMGNEDGLFETLLKTSYPTHYQRSVHPDEEGRPPRILEAIAEGVTFTSLEHSAAADSIVVLRPNLSRQSIANSIFKAFQYSGRPYDFNFDFRTDSELVCSELIYKAYEGGSNFQGLSLPLTEVMGRPLLSPNEIARLYDSEYKKETPQLSFIVFYDGIEKEHKAYISTADAFRKSWKRPKWYIWQQD